MQQIFQAPRLRHRSNAGGKAWNSERAESPFPGVLNSFAPIRLPYHLPDFDFGSGRRIRTSNLIGRIKRNPVGVGACTDGYPG
jgi:hypothetical protein